MMDEKTFWDRIQKIDLRYMGDGLLYELSRGVPEWFYDRDVIIGYLVSQGFFDRGGVFEHKTKSYEDGFPVLLVLNGGGVNYDYQVLVALSIVKEIRDCGFHKIFEELNECK